jgi:hypothetical protein
MTGGSKLNHSSLNSFMATGGKTNTLTLYGLVDYIKQVPLVIVRTVLVESINNINQLILSAHNLHRDRKLMLVF